MKKFDEVDFIGIWLVLFIIFASIVLFVPHLFEIVSQLIIGYIAGNWMTNTAVKFATKEKLK